MQKGEVGPEDVRHLETTLRRRLNDALSGLPRLGEAQITCAWHPTFFSVKMVLNGWSPTLHYVRMERTESLQLTQAALTEAHDVLGRHLDMVGDLQRRRQEDAKALGFRRPLPLRNIEHLHVDKAMPLLRGDGAEKARAAVLESVRRAHRSSIRYDGGQKMLASGVMLGDHPSEDADAWLRICAPNIKVRTADGRIAASVFGFHVTVRTPHLEQPELDALVGKPLGDLVRMHPIIDGRTIRSVANSTLSSSPRVVARVEMNVDPIATVLGPASS